MRDQITPEMIKICQEAVKNAEYDCETLKIQIAEFAPCSITQALFPQIIDMALEHLKRKASHSLVEWVEEEPKTDNIGWNKEDGNYLKNKTLPAFDWNLVTNPTSS